MFAIVKTGGKQYRVAENDVITVERLQGEAGDTVAFEEVLLVGDDKKTETGAPLVSGATVAGEILEQVQALYKLEIGRPGLLIAVHPEVREASMYVDVAKLAHAVLVVAAISLSLPIGRVALGQAALGCVLRVQAATSGQYACRHHHDQHHPRSCR